MITLSKSTDLMMKLVHKKFLIFFLVVFGAALAVLRVHFDQGGDIGLFITVSSLVAKGYKLYTEAFEIKDPLFFYSAAISFKVFGIKGFFILDLLYITISPLFSYFVLKTFQVRDKIAIFTSIIFSLTLTGLYYESFRTQFAAILIVICIYIAAALRNPIYIGFLTFLLFGFKLPMIIFVIPIIFIYPEIITKSKNFIQFISAFFIPELILLVAMFFRGELYFYFIMIKENMFYSSNFQEVVGLPSGYLGHLVIWAQERSSLQAFIFLQLINLFMLIKVNHFRKLGLFNLFNSFFVFLYLFLTLIWTFHHLQILSLFLLFQIAYMLSVLQIVYKKIKSRFIKSAMVIISCVLFILITRVFGTDYSLKPKMKLSNWYTGGFYEPSEIKVINSIKKNRFTFARLGANDDGGYAAFLPDKARYVCARSILQGNELKSEAERFLKCLKSDADFIIIAPSFDVNSERQGIYQEIYLKSYEIINDSFTCTKEEFDEYRLCAKRNL